jgi:hypothetical protein
MKLLMIKIQKENGKIIYCLGRVIQKTIDSHPQLCKLYFSKQYFWIQKNYLDFFLLFS